MPDNKNQPQSRWPLYISITIFVTLVLLYFLVPSVNGFFTEAWTVLTGGDEQEIKDWVEQFSWRGPLILILAMVVQMFLLVVPTPLLMVVTVLAYGPFFGTLLILAGILCASSLGYGLGVVLGTPFIDRMLGVKSKEKVEGFIQDYGFWAIFVTRISPFLSNDAVSFVAGILRMGYVRFIAATMLGIFPLTVLIAYLGESNDRLKYGLVWIGIISLIGFLAYLWWDKKRNK